MRGEELTAELVLLGTMQGAFPMTDFDDSVNWYRPNERCLFPIEGIHVSRSLAKTLRKVPFEVTFDQAFDDVIRGCLRPPGENWLSEHFFRAYGEAHRQGWAHSCEVWLDGELVGGIYGTAIGAVFSAESMFHRRNDMSKVALKHLVDRCRELGFAVFDAQIMNPHLASLGAFSISDLEYEQLLRRHMVQQTAWGADVRSLLRPD
jgi:leucyl/phenylalanyl-tRNA--protein transferase